MVARGCGESRAEDALYLTVETSEFGQPIEAFLVDPAVAWNGGQLRAPMKIKDKTGTVHLVLGCGKTFYPFVSDVVEEYRLYGCSKRVPRNFQVERLDPVKSKLLLVHPRAIPNFQYDLDCVTCPKNNNNEHECVNALWHLSSLKDFGDKHHVERDYNVLMVKVATPSATYYVSEPLKPKQFIDQYQAGIFLAFPMTLCCFEYVNRKGNVPSKLKERIEKAKFRLDVVPQ